VSSWSNLRSEIAAINPELAAIIDSVHPKAKHKLYIIEYPYGEMVFNDGDLNILNTSDEVKEALNYRVIPLGMVLEKSLEVHVNEEQRTVPLTVLNEGAIFGIWELFDPKASYFVKSAWSVSSGARSIFLLPPIANKDSFLRLKKEFNVSNPPNKIKDHWELFKQIAKSSSSANAWHSKVLFFSREWIKDIENNVEWKELKLYLYQQAWKQSMYWRFSSTMNLIWQFFTQHLCDINLKFNPSSLETLKHIVTIGIGELPAFSANISQELCAPVSLLQKAFLDIYKLDYVPTIMAAAHLSNKQAESRYCSCNFPTFIETSYINGGIRNALANIKEIHDIFTEFKKSILAGKTKIHNTPIRALINNASFDFIHTHYDDTLTLSTKLPDQDRCLLDMPSGYTRKEFCSGSNFFKGCVRVKNNVY
jgi:hypothetical protein